MSGVQFDLTDDKNILSIKSPKKSVKGPYKVVYKNVSERWAVVALKWDDIPRLGIRWFWSTKGNPLSRANPTWFIVPNELSDTILNGLTLDFQFKSRIKDFLSGKIEGREI